MLSPKLSGNHVSKSSFNCPVFANVDLLDTKTDPKNPQLTFVHAEMGQAYQNVQPSLINTLLAVICGLYVGITDP